MLNQEQGVFTQENNFDASDNHENEGDRIGAENSNADMTHDEMRGKDQADVTMNDESV